jgi:5-methylcytosine-specific restriction endonuclease McrA
MLFNYQFVEHNITKMQSYIDYIFENVWCNAKQVEYGPELYEGNAELFQIFEYFYGEDCAEKPVKSAKFFLEGLVNIFNAFAELDQEQIDQIKIWYQSNNNIESSCKNEGDSFPINYALLKSEPSLAVLTEQLESFFSKLYSNNFLINDAVKAHVGTLKGHYKLFMQTNDEGICPFCGLSPLDGEWSETREAYDHYLPKSKYPFNSINFFNLVPACNKCNSGNKGVKDPIELTDNTRRKAFYPYSNEQPDINLSMTFVGGDWEAYVPDNIAIAAESEAHQEEVNTWFELFGLESRYKSHLCSKPWGKLWLKRLNDWLNRGETAESFFAEEDRQTYGSNLSDFYFIKAPFLIACVEAGLFENIIPNN